MKHQFNLTIVEDSLSEMVVRKICSGLDIDPGSIHGLQGVGYIKSKIRKFNYSANSLKILVLADLDNRNLCPADLISAWIGPTVNPGMLFRFAVVEIESWLLADRDRIAEFLNVSPNLIPSSPDVLDDPKQKLIEIAKRSHSREIKSCLVPDQSGTAKVGKEYNLAMKKFVEFYWQPETAERNSPSLLRSRNAIRAFWGNF